MNERERRQLKALVTVLVLLVLGVAYIFLHGPFSVPEDALLVIRYNTVGGIGTETIYICDTSRTNRIKDGTICFVPCGSDLLMCVPSDRVDMRQLEKVSK